MYRARSKRAERRRFILTYTLVPLLILGLVTLLVMYMLGYRFSMESHTVSQGGLLQLGSQPAGAEVTVDTTTLPGRTLTRYDAPAGLHTVVMRRDGYIPWQKTVTVEPGKVLWLTYARLIPQTIKQSTVKEYASVSSSVAANQRMIALPDPAKPELAVTALGDTPRQTTVAIPVNISTRVTAASRYEVVRASVSGRYVLVKHSAGKQHEWWLVDVQSPERSHNITTIAGEWTAEPLLGVSNEQQLYVIVNHELRLIDVARQTLSAPIMSNVAEAQQSATGIVSYVTHTAGTPKQRAVGYYTPGADKPHTIKSYYDDGKVPLRLRIAEYSGSHYVVLQYGTTIEISSTRLVSSGAGQDLSLVSLATLAVPDGSDYVSFSPSSRFVVSQHGSTYLTYDLELNSLSTATLKGEAQVSRPLAWLDTHVIWSDRDNQLRLYEFDGAYANTIGEVIEGQAVALSSDGKYIYAFQPGKDGSSTQLVRFHLRVE